MGSPVSEDQCGTRIVLHLAMQRILVTLSSGDPCNGTDGSFIGSEPREYGKEGSVDSNYRHTFGRNFSMICREKRFYQEGDVVSG